MSVEIRRGVPLWPFTTLRVGGLAERFAVARTVDDLAELALLEPDGLAAMTVLGWGSNVLPSDEGVPGMVVINRCRQVYRDSNGDLVADAGVGFQDLCLWAAQRGLGGMEFAVGIPGTLGGALVSNAGAYRSAVSERLVGIEVVEGGERRWEEPSWMQFSYRDSKLRSGGHRSGTLLRARFRLAPRAPELIYADAREFQRQRIGKQPPQASAGSFFKNVMEPGLVDRLPDLPPGLRQAGVVPAGYLIEACGLSGAREGGARVSLRHANFLVNAGGATADDFRRLALRVRIAVADQFAVNLSEEILYLGKWSPSSEVKRATGLN